MPYITLNLPFEDIKKLIVEKLQEEKGFPKSTEVKSIVIDPLKGEVLFTVEWK